jgi:hypothetical protein
VRGIADDLVEVCNTIQIFGRSYPIIDSLPHLFSVRRSELATS